jgi:uncharacterized protein YfaS (alpha-2-macroglobulin family)
MVVWILAVGGAPAGERPARPPGSPAFDPQREFTLLAVEPDVAQGEVRLVFSHPVPKEVLQAHLKFLPRLKVDWAASRLSPDGILTLKGAFRFGRRYAVHLPEDLEVAGRRYRPTVSHFFLPDRPPFLEFVDDKTVLERQSRQLFHVRAENAGPLEVEALTVPPLLLAPALAAQERGRPPAELRREMAAALEELAPLLGQQRSLAPFAGEAVLEKQLFGVTLDRNRLQAVSLPLTFRGQRQEGGLVYLRVRHAGEGEAATWPRLFRLTDVGLTYKRGQGGLLVWATSLREGRPLSGVQVLACTRDFQVFPLGETGPDGVLLFAGREVTGLSLARPGAYAPVTRRVAPGEVAFLLAGKERDRTYVEVRPQGHLTPASVWQEPEEGPVPPHRGHLFTERGVYRPGETVYFKGTVRAWQGGRIGAPPQGRVAVSAVNPKGETLLETELSLSEFGTAAGELRLPGHSPLGTYTLTMRFGADLAPDPAREESEEGAAPRRPREEVRTTFEVQEFTPPRHFVEVDFSRLTREVPEYVGAAAKREFVSISLSGRYYAGGPVKNGQVRWKISRARTSFPQAERPGFTFGYDEGRREELIEAGQALLDEQGRTEILFPLEPAVLTGRQGLLVVATVLDFDGRAASVSRTFQVEPEVLLGLKLPPGPLRVGEELRVGVTAWRHGRPLAKATLQAEVFTEGWSYVAKRNEQGDLYWDDQPVWRRVSSQNLSLAQGEAVFTTGLAHGGQYLVSVSYRDPAGRTFAAALPVAVEWAVDDEDRRKRPVAYQPLSLAADRPAYEPGQTARLFLTASRPVSHYLVTVERQGIFQHRVVAATAPSQELELPLLPEYAPNVYVSALGLSPRGEFPLYSGAYDSEAPGCLWATVNLPVRLKVEELKVAIAGERPELKAEPGHHLTLDFRVTGAQGRGAEAEMAVAVVDEAVLALTAYKTPTLESLLRFDLPLRVSTGDLRALLLHQTPFRPARSEPLTGGGGLQEDLVAKLRKDFKAVAYYNPTVRTDPQGRAQVSFTLPDNLTTFRVFAVALDRGSRFASAERPLQVRKDFYLEPGMPGFFTVGDTFRFLVNAVNQTPTPGEVSLSVAAEGGLFLKAEEPRAPLPATDSRKLAVSGEAAEAGPATVRLAARLGTLTDAVELPVRVRSPFLSDTQVHFGAVTGSAEVAVPLPPEIAADPQAKKLAGEIKAVLTLSGSPFLRLRPALQYLFTYPYGCAEQTASGVLGLAALRRPVRQGLIERPSPEELDRFLDQGISRLLTMQTTTGGFAYWPGHREAHPWASLYATAALAVARQQGLAVPDAGLARAWEYLAARLREARTPPEYKAFGAYLLALGGVLDSRLYAQVAPEEPRLSREGKLLLILAAAQANLKPVKELRAALRPLLLPQAEKDTWQDEFQARFRAQALAVLAGQMLLPGDPAVREAAHTLLGGMERQGRWTSTSDTGWCLLALAEYFQAAVFSREPADFTVSQPGGPAQRLRLDPKGFRTVALNPQLLLPSPRVSLAGPPGTTWLYELELTSPRVQASRQGETAGFRVKKTIANTDGSPEIRVGDLVKVTVELETDLRRLRYVVLDDPLPAGLVAINTVFKTEEPLPEGEEQESEEDFDYLDPGGRMRFRPTFFEIRQDRVLAFRDWLWRGPQVFEYYARAVCEGSFVVPATQVAAMYAPHIRGASPPSRLVIGGR